MDQKEETCAQCKRPLAARPPDGRCPYCRQALQHPAAETHLVDRNETDELPRPPANGSAPPAPADVCVPEEELERLPRRVNNYELLEIIGRGGMGVVYRARHVLLERFVALKLVRRISAEHDEALRFVAEAQVTGQIEHPNIVPVHEVGADPRGRPYFVMKLVRGRSLSQILSAIEKRDPATLKGFPQHRLLSIFCDVCQAVAFAHSKGVLHRDLKPGNVMIGDFGEVLLMDWGLAKKIGSADGPARADPKAPREGQVHTVRDHRHETSARFVAGTPEYMSPEQALGEAAALQPRSDVYSLGAVLFELLTFRPPHLDPDTTRLITKVTSEPVRFPPPNPQRPRVAKALRAIALKALALNPELRYGSALELLQDVRAYLEDRPVAACPDMLLDRTARLLRHHGTLIATVAGALLILSGGASLALWQVRQSDSARVQAERNALEQRQKALSDERLRLEAQGEAAEQAAKRVKAEARELETRRAAEETKRRELENLKNAMPHYLNGLEMLQRRQYDAAVKQLEDAVGIDPQSVLAQAAHFACGEACAKNGTPAAAKAAIVHFQEADRLTRQFDTGQNPKGDPRALLRCGDISWRLLQDSTGALRYYGMAAKGDQRDPYAALARAYVLILNARDEQNAETRTEKARQALELALQIVDSDNRLWEAHYVAGSLYAGQELTGALQPDLLKARYRFTLALDLEPSQPDSLFGRAEVARKLGDKPQALLDYESVLRVRPDFAPAWLARIELLLDAGRAEDALAASNEALQRTPDSAALYASSARALADLKRWAEARGAADEVLKRKADDASMLLLRARAQFGEGRFADALTDLNGVLRLEPDRLDALLLRADARLRAGQALEAEADFRRLLERAPARSELWRGLGDALRAQEKIKEALAAYTTYLGQQQGDVEMRLTMARLLTGRPEAAWFAPDQAVQLAREADRLKPEDPRVWIVLAEALMASGKRQEALDQIERAYTRFPTNKEVQAAREKLRTAVSTVKPKL